MAFSNDITLDTHTFSNILRVGKRGVYRDAAAPLDKPATLTISHETTKSGRLSSAVIIDLDEVIPCSDTCSTVPVADNIRMLVKLSYNPLAGRADLPTDLALIKAHIIAFLVNSEDWPKFLNQES